MIKVTNLVRKFQMGDSEIIALKGLSFVIPKKQYVAITGKSGSGKSTLLYQLSLLDIPNEGEIILNQLDVSQFSGNERVQFRLDNLGYIFQDYAILPSLTAKENVILPMLMKKIQPSKAEKEAENALERVGLADRMDNLPSQLSGGQQQRVSIARSIVHNPKILFADEPTANLDTESSGIILDIFKQLHNEGQTIVMVTHEKEYAAITDRIIELKDGEIISDVLTRKRKSKKQKKQK